MQRLVGFPHDSVHPHPAVLEATLPFTRHQLNLKPCRPSAPTDVLRCSLMLQIAELTAELEGHLLRRAQLRRGSVPW